MVGAAHNEIGLHANGAKLLHAVLGRLRFNLVSCGNIGHQGYVHKQHIAIRALFLKLTSRLDEGLGFDVANSAADLRDNNVGIGLLGDAIQAFFDCVGHMRDNLHGATQKVASTFTGYKAFVDGALGEVGFSGKAFVDKTLIMPQVKVALMAIIGHKHLAMLERAHGARVNIQVRVHLLHGYLVAARLEQMSQRSSGDALTQGRNNATSYEDVLSHDSPLQQPYQAQ